MSKKSGKNAKKVGKLPKKSKFDLWLEKRERKKAKKKAAKAAKINAEKRAKAAKRAKEKKIRAMQKEAYLRKKYPPVSPRNTALTTFITILILIGFAFLIYTFLNPFAEVKFDPRGGGEVHSIIVWKDWEIKEPIHPVKPGYTFDYWSTDCEENEAFDFSKGTDKSITLYANWTINYYAVNAYHYDGNYENDTPSLLFTFTIEDEVMLPAQSEMIKPGYIFAGWYTDYRFSPLTQVIMIPKGTASHVNIYAKWVAA